MRQIGLEVHKLRSGIQTKKQRLQLYIYIDIFDVHFVFLFECIKTAKAIGPNLCMATHVTPGKVFGGSKLKNFAQRQMLIFINFENAPN